MFIAVLILLFNKKSDPLSRRVPVKTLFEYLENGYSVEEFVECFPSVSRELVRQLLERSEQALLSPAA